MNMMKHWNDAVSYIEENLCAGFDLGKAARIACVTQDSFLRFFSYMTGMTLKEYVRKRRLSLAALELQRSGGRILDITLKYGNDSADAFARSFQKQHGVTPAQCRDTGCSMKLYPPVSFYVGIKGAEKMDIRFFDLAETKVFGISQPYEGQGYETRESLRHIMWHGDLLDVPGKLATGKWDDPGSTSYDGLWFGIWKDGRYMIARETPDAPLEGLETFTLPAGKYAAVRSEKGARAWEVWPKLFPLLLESWLPSSGYHQREDIVIEALYLQTNHDVRQKERYFEAWVPVEEA